MPHYSMIIQWSHEDNVFIVSLPEFPHCKTHGETYAEAVQSGQDMIETIIEFYRQEQKPLPEPQTFIFA
jgi:predicted RNase H-like HicB family nuclease